MDNLPLVSLLVPCYNHEVFLPDCLRSLMGQTYKNIELLVCDDCSTDGSWAVICSFEEQLRQRFPRVVLQRNECNRGVTRNVNALLSLAEGCFIKTLASDDALVPTAIEEMVLRMQQEPGIQVLVAGGETVTPQQHYPDFGPGNPVYTQAPDLQSAGLMERIALRNDIFAPGAMVRRAVYEQYGSYDESISVEDFEFWLRLADKKVAFGYLEKALVRYRISGNSITAQTGNSGLERRRRMFHGAEMQTLKKYSHRLPGDVYARAVLCRLRDERWLAQNNGLWQWDRELGDAWRNFREEKNLPLGERLDFTWQYVKKEVRAALRR